jgi:hypothetical protein
MLDDRAAPVGYIIFCLVVGAFLIVIPWHPLWESNFLLAYAPSLRLVLLNNYLRGAVSGLGAVDVALGLAAIGRLIRSLRFSRSHPAGQPTSDPSGHSAASSTTSSSASHSE